MSSSQQVVTTNRALAPEHKALKVEPPAGEYVQRGHTLTTVKETEKTTKRNRRGHPVTKSKTRTVYLIDNKEVKVNWFDKLRIRFMSTYEKQAFLAKKLLRQEKAARKKAEKAEKARRK